jgi:phospholipid/cholesterol/gamma-HCH transport system substrate-binding protein
MQKQAPNLGQVTVIAVFVLSCVGILTYLWVSFGGGTPLRPNGYEFKVPLQEATQVAQQSDVRISGVSVGKVKGVALSSDNRHAVATIELDSAYAPIRADTRAIIRSKTLLGEAYIELTPGNRSSPALPEGGSLPTAQVAPVVQLDEILRTFNPKTRAAFQTWMQNAAIATNGRGGDLNTAIGELEPTFSAFDRVFRTLDTQQAAVSQLFANGRDSLDALARRSGDLSGLISSANRVFQVTGARNRDLEAAFRAFPTFLDESRATVQRLKTFSGEADPLMRQLIPAGRQLSPTLTQIARAAPSLRTLFTGLPPVNKRAPAGLGAFRRTLAEDFPPLLVALDPFLRNLNPIVQAVGDYSPEVTALFANATAATNGILPGASGQQAHYLRGLAVLSPDSLSTFSQRLKINRNNAYAQPGLYRRLPGLLNFETRQCSTGIHALLDPSSPTKPSFNARTGGDVSAAQTFFNRIKLYAFDDQTDTDNVPAPGCAQQPPLQPIGAPGAPTNYLHVLRQGP